MLFRVDAIIIVRFVFLSRLAENIDGEKQRKLSMKFANILTKEERRLFLPERISGRGEVGILAISNNHNSLLFLMKF